MTCIMTVLTEAFLLEDYEKLCGFLNKTFIAISLICVLSYEEVIIKGLCCAFIKSCNIFVKYNGLFVQTAHAKHWFLNGLELLALVPLYRRVVIAPIS